LKPVLIVALAVQGTFTVSAVVTPAGTDVGEPLIRLTAIVPLLLWAVGIARRDRYLWLAGAISHLLHVAVAFHLGHAWSHAHAVEHVQRAGGFGEGIFVSHGFAVVWLGDALVWVISPSYYVRRPRSVHLGVHLYLAFVIVNATIVFGSLPARLLGVAVLVALGIARCRR
jgi:hypothetical protein